jgi:hypothetical protein
MDYRGVHYLVDLVLMGSTVLGFDILPVHLYIWAMTKLCLPCARLVLSRKKRRSPYPCDDCLVLNVDERTAARRRVRELIIRDRAWHDEHDTWRMPAGECINYGTVNGLRQEPSRKEKESFALRMGKEWGAEDLVLPWIEEGGL